MSSLAFVRTLPERRPLLIAAALAAVAAFSAAFQPTYVALAAAAALGVAFFATAPAIAAAGGLAAASFLSGISVPAGTLAVRPEQAVGALFLGCLLLRRDLGAVPRLSLLPALWLSAGVFGAFGEVDSGRAAVHALRLAVTVLPALFLPALLRDRDAAERGWDLFLLFAAIESALGLAAAASHALFGTVAGVTVEKTLLFVHPHGTLLEPNLLGTLSAAAGAAFLLRARRARGLRGRVLPAFLAALCLGALAVSVTRSAWIALPVGVVAALLAHGGTKTAVRMVPAAMLLAAALVFVVSSPRGTTTRLSEARIGIAGKIASLGRISEDPNVLVRLASYREALRLFADRPLLGAGHGAMERIPGRDDRRLAWAGNLEIHLLADTGLVGLALVGVFVSIVFVRTFRHARGDRRAGERLAALVVLVVCAQATETTWLSSFWVIFGLSIAALPRPAEATRPLRILYVHPSDELYGSDRVLLELVRRLDPTRFSPRVLVSTDVPYAGRLSGRLRDLGIPVTHLRIGVLRRAVLSSPLTLARYFVDAGLSTLRIAVKILREDVDIVHANTVTVFPAAVGARLAGRWLVWHVHEIVTERPGRGFLLTLVRLLADRVVVVSEAARESFGASGHAIEVVPNGIDERTASPPSSSRLVAYVGRLSRRKGPDVLLEAAARIRDRSSLKVVFAGDEFGGGSALESELRSLARERGLEERVEFRPFREDVSALLAEAAVVVSPSVLPESFGLVLLEAMAAGRPVVASDLGGPREIIVDGETGFLVPPGDAAALARALDRLLDDPVLAKRMGEAGRRRARRFFDIDTTASRFAAIYESLR